MIGTMNVTVRLTVQECCNCGMTFGVPQDFDNWRRSDHKSFCCPWGHWQSYNGKSEAEQLRDQLVREKQRTEQAEADAAHQRKRVALKERQISARKAVATRLRNKLAKGRCPCCSHEFKDLRRHMKVEHPKWNLEKAAAAIAAKAVA